MVRGVLLIRGVTFVLLSFVTRGGMLRFVDWIPSIPSTPRIGNYDFFIRVVGSVGAPRCQGGASLVVA
ncbi:hypothetical protein OF83DRAFT_675941 [Amylostereum chailletii]|nr:hypothetical protein OF83DRAFT_675941 [Amylostereum chailletii]